ncbi:MAG: hypothetical protein J5598_01680 [Clostridia bacterium]|nr:hypothetical protein [Clostridia bacterium]
MIIKNTNGFMVFRFDSIQEMELLYKVLPIPNLVPFRDQPLTYVPEAQAKIGYLIAGDMINPLAVPIVSCADVIEGFEENRLCYSLTDDAIVTRDLILTKVSLHKNQFGKYMGNFILQPYSMVGLLGRAADYEAVYDANRGIFVYTYIRFEIL